MPCPCRLPPARRAAAEKPASKAEKAAAKPHPKSERAYTGKLPGNVDEMREHILAARPGGRHLRAQDGHRMERAQARLRRRGQRRSDRLLEEDLRRRRGQGERWPRSPISWRCRRRVSPSARIPRTTLVYVWPYLAELPARRAHVRPSRSISIGSCRLRPLSPCRKRRSGHGGGLPSAPTELGITFRKYD